MPLIKAQSIEQEHRADTKVNMIMVPYDRAAPSAPQVIHLPEMNYGFNQSK